MTKNIVIIGAGLGGLFSGAILSKEGCKVTIIEKNPIIGGGLQSFTRFGEVYDAAMHVIGGMQPGCNIRRICDYLEITNDIHIKDVDPNCTDMLYFAEDKRYYTIAQGKENYIKTLASQFPEDEKDIREYVNAMFAIVDEMDLFNLRPSSNNIFMHSEDFLMSANDFIAKYLHNRHLQSVVAYMNPLYSGVKDKTPAYIHSIISVHYIKGPSRFAGGSRLFANTLENFIKACGGEIITSDAVTNISTTDKHIDYVTTKHGRQISGDYYISDIHPCTLFKLFDNIKALPKAYRTRLETLPNSYSAFTVYLKLKPNTIRYMNHSCYYMNRYSDIWKFGKDNTDWPIGFLYMTPPEIEQGEYSTKMVITSPMAWSNVVKWENTVVGHRGDEYEKWKIECAEMLISKIEEIYPDIRDCITDMNTSSPLTIRDYYGIKEGAMYGFTKECDNIAMSQIPVFTKIDNLLLTGQNVNLHGFCGVALTSINTCEAILGRNYIINKLNSL